MPTVTETRSVKEEAIVAPFTIEADHPRNCDLLLQSIPGARLRSAISGSKTVTNKRTGAVYIPPDQSAYLGQFPPIPGMQLHVNPAKCSYRITDPLEDDEDLCEKIKKTIDRVSAIRITGKLRGVAKQEGTLDVHRMKTLVREMLWLLNAKEARVVRGTEPTMESVEKLPGHFLLNPGARVANTQPMFEKDWDSWIEKAFNRGG